MIEILIIYLCCKNLGKMLRAKGYSAIGFQILLVVIWFPCQVVGAIAGAVVQVIVSGPSDGISPIVYLCALLGAAAGALAVFLIAGFLKPKPGFAQRTNAFPVEPDRQSLPPGS